MCVNVYPARCYQETRRVDFFGPGSNVGTYGCDDPYAVLVLVDSDVGHPGWCPCAIDDVAIADHQIMHESLLMSMRCIYDTRCVGLLAP